MPFVKLDCGILDSTLWLDRAAREVFVTALLMAEPRELQEPTKQIKVGSLQETGYTVPPGWYGFVHASGPGIVHRAGIPDADGMAALQKLGETDPESRTPDHDGRRMVRVDGGFIILNFQKYRERDHTAAERSRRYRGRHAVASHRHAVTPRSVTQAEAEAEADTEKEKKGATVKRSPKLSDDQWMAEMVKIYPALNVSEEFGKARAWAMTNRREVTRRFLLNWLNRASERRATFAPAAPTMPQAAPVAPTTPYNAERIKEACRVELEKLRADGKSYDWDGGIKGPMKPEIRERVLKLRARIDEATKAIAGVES